MVHLSNKLFLMEHPTILLTVEVGTRLFHAGQFAMAGYHGLWKEFVEFPKQFKQGGALLDGSGIGYLITDLPRVTLPRWWESNLYRIECRKQDLPLIIVNLRSIFGEEESEVLYKSSLYRTRVKMSLSKIQRLAKYEANF